MTEDLVKRLRAIDKDIILRRFDPEMSFDGMTAHEAADRIERLEAALDEAAFSQTLFDAVVGQRNKATDRIEKLEAALREIAEANSVQTGTDKDMYRRWRYVATNAIDIARKALEGKDAPQEPV